MGAALSILILLSFSVFVMRIAAVALRLTGMTESSARFQSLSAFSGTGFTTSEAEMIVNYPLRRRIISGLMVIGNLGLVSVFATLVSSLVRAGGDVDAVAQQLGWLAAGMALLWFLVLNKKADRLLCALIGRALESTEVFGRRKYVRLLQVRDGHSVCEHTLPARLRDESQDRLMRELAELDLKLLDIEVTAPSADEKGRLLLFGPDFSHEAFGCENCRGEHTVRSQ